MIAQPFSTRETSASSEELDHGTCFDFVGATTSARTRVNICCTSSPGVPMWRDSAAENGLLAPSPSSATCPGAVAKALSVPAPSVEPVPRLVGAAMPGPASMPRLAPAGAACCAIGLVALAAQIQLMV